ncbi:hypothetical protein ABT357_27200 [Streptomyces albidoflavus]|uniref:hypothetical protein n=1 Tax=Streptomyces albidoflavus TaxID=1886 RepID=UPI0033307982
MAKQCDFWEDMDPEGTWGGAPMCEGPGAVEDAINGVVESGFQSLVDAFQSGAIFLVKEVGMSWLDIDAPTLSADSGGAGFVLQSTHSLTQLLAVISLIIAGAHMAITRRNDPGRDIATAMLRLTIVSAAGVAVANLVMEAGDSYSSWVVERGLGCGGATKQGCIDEFVVRMRDMTVLAQEDQLALTLVVSFLLMVAGLLQLIFVLIRDSLLVIIIGFLPLAAALSETPWGREWWPRLIGGGIGIAAWAPAASTAYGAGFVMFGGVGQDELPLIQQLYGVTLLIMAAIFFPLIMKAAGPVGASIVGGGSSGRSGIGRIASGAISLRSGGRGGGKGGGGGGQGGGKGATSTGSPSGGSSPGGGKSGGPGGGKGPTGGGPAGGSSGGSGKGSSSGPGGTGSGKGPGPGGPSGGQPPAGPSGGGTRSGAPAPPGGGPSGGGPKGGGPSGGPPPPSSPPAPRRPQQGGPRGSNSKP